MKTVLAFFIGLTVVALVSAAAIHRRNESAAEATRAQQTYWVNGIVREVLAAEKTVRVEHEEIEGYMAAMTMPLEVRDPSLLNGLDAGDQIRFRLAVTEEDSWIESIEKTGREMAASQTSPDLLASVANRVETGEVVPDFEVTNQDGARVRLRDFKGKPVVLTFIYTRCPLPNFCPFLSKSFLALQERLRKDLGDEFQLLSITIDPEFDRPEVLKEYAGRYQAAPDVWTFATGTRETINEVAALFGLVHQPESGFINHDLRTALIGPDGRLVHTWRSNVWTPYEVHRRLREAIGRPMP